MIKKKPDNPNEEGYYDASYIWVVTQLEERQNYLNLLKELVELLDTKPDNGVAFLPETTEKLEVCLARARKVVKDAL